ncbi:hypothetical protein ASPVEDRAFT_65770 [Aspergillus versicolor CBS 583.65]|uniref:Carrier domain-containing protein n=1 Tax=Aspergillus versicolor CBS 583.65 TaxID=1036611 RepID=A0A1L9Q0R6_ASPVE|nr:uncharacterized protein ASPVEDRAFT_65770 [Aspergillus versicolor CBS 583.65]OJJ07364.1 hypothetical protein ASPVEDRAFT_65770 [Aspergillus versicolor CBS 583.65]
MQFDPCLFPALGEDICREVKTRSVDLGFDDLRKLEGFCAANQTSFYASFTAVWAIVLRRYVELDNLHFRVSHNWLAENGDSAAVDGIQVMEVRIDPDTTVKGLLGQESHRINPFQPNNCPHFNTGVWFTTVDGRHAGESNGTTTAANFAWADGPGCELLFVVNLQSSTPSLLLQYSPTLLSELHARSLEAAVSQVIKGIMQDPMALVKDVSLVGEMHIQEIARWNNKPMSSPPEHLIHEIISRQALTRPTAQAVCSWDGELTYGELDDLSTRLAGLLSSHGVGPGIMVPLCFKKSLWAIVAMVAVVKAGGAFVPIDPSHPVKRLKDIITQVKATLVLASDECAHLVGEMTRTVITVSDDTIAMITGMYNVEPRTVQRSHTAYILFTSGSTGRPKACVHDHGSLAAVSCHGASLCIRQDSRVLQFASYSFGVSLVEIFCTLTKGATVCIPSEHERLNDLLGALHRMNADWALLTPSVVSQLSSEGPLKLKSLAVGGEALSKSNINGWQGRLNLLYAYGLTEWAGMCSVQQDVKSTTNPMSIGVSPNANFWLVDPENHDKLAPIGAIAELVVEGPSLARGYLDDIKRTTEAFIHSPSWMQQFRSPARQTRLYKTGDLVRYGSSGNVIYIGRKDTQVKIRGQRVELGEVEQAVLRNLRGANQVIAGLINPRGQHGMLAAFVYSGEQDGISPLPSLLREPDDQFREAISTIESSLRSALPDYMLPQIYLPLHHVPLTVSAKIDRRKLQAVANALSSEQLQSYASTKVDVVAPRSSIEKTLHTLLMEVLGLEAKSFGIDDSFLAIGGDSLTAMKLVTRCRAAQVNITVQDVFNHKTVRNLALVSGRACDSGSREGTGMVPFNVSPAQALLLSQHPEHNLHTERIVVGMKQGLEPQYLRTVTDALVKRHPLLRARFALTPEGAWRQTIVPFDIKRTYTYNSQSLSSSDSVTAIEAVTATEIGLDIEKGPVFAASHFNCGGDGQFLCLVAHALVIDSGSWTVILGDLDALLQGQTALLDSRPFLFPSWCEQSSEGHDHCAVAPQHLTPRAVVYDRCADNVHSHSVSYLEEGFTLNGRMTRRLLGDSNIALRTEPAEIVVAALLHSRLQGSAEQKGISITICKERTQLLDNSECALEGVGMFTTLRHIQIRGHGTTDAVDMLRQVKDTYRLGNASRSAQHGLDATTAEGDFVPPDMLVSFDALKAPPWEGETMKELSRGSMGLSIKNVLAQYSPLGVSASLIDGQLSINIAAAHPSYSRANLQKLAQGYHQSLEQLVERLCGMEGVFTLSDFPLLALSTDEFDSLVLRELPKAGLSRSTGLEDAYPCSPTQQGILLSQARDPGHYRMSIEWRITAADQSQPVDVDKLKRAWFMVVDRHDILRTICMANMVQGSYAIQVLLGRGTGRLLDQSQVNADDCKTLHSAQMANQGVKVRLPRLAISERGSSSLVCTLDIDHTLVDATSMMIIKRDLMLAYVDRLPLGGSLQYREFISYLRGVRTQEAQVYWETRLADCEPCLFPHLDESTTIPNEFCTVDIELERSSALFNFAEKTGITLATVFHVAWGLVLRAFAATDTVIFGYMTSGRDVDLEGIEDAVGPFINMLICRIDFEDSHLVSEILEKTQGDFLHSLSFQHFSLAELLHGIGASGQALYNTCVTFPPQVKATECDKSGIQIEETQRYDPSEFDIVLEGRVEAGRIGASLRYWTSSLSQEKAIDIARLVEHTMYEVIGLSSRAGMIRQIDLVGDRNRQQLMAWNSAVPERIDRCVHHLIHDRCLAQPDAPAVCAWDGDLTYREVDGLSTILAIHLADLGVGPEVFVAVYFEKSRWAIIAILGVIKAGGAFLLLDPSHPKRRLQGICHAVSASVIVSSTQNALAAGELAAQVVLLGDNESAWREGHLQQHRGRDEHWESSSVTPENALYAIFTSGSTGTPKGAVVHHAAFSTSATAHGKAFHIHPGSRVLQFASYVFDASVVEIITTLIAGGCICVPSDTARQSNLSQVAREMEITWAVLTPSVARTLQPGDIPTLEILVLVGEALSASDIRLWSTHVTLLNGYGPAECAAASTVASALSDTDPSNIGRSVGCSCWIVDRGDHNRLMPIGAVGELLLEGPTIGRGYIGDPEKTAASFIKPPDWLQLFRSSRGSTKMYKTGDLVQYAANGTLRFISRKDNQVKIRGQRVELGEVEYHVQECLEPSSAVMADIISPPGARGPMLVAFVWSAAFGDSDTEKTERTDNDIFLAPRKDYGLATVLTHLAERLPTYMVPAAIIPLAYVPLTKAGKTDRRLLRQQAAGLTRDDLERLSGSRQMHKSLPSTPAERMLQKVWAQTLNMSVSRIGMDDTFFSIGGDSITAMQVAAKCRASGFSITVADIFELKTIASLAKILQEHDMASLSGGEDFDSPFDLSPIQAMFLEHEPQAVNHFNQSILVPVSEKLPSEAYANAIAAIVGQHSMLRARFSQSPDGVWTQHVKEKADSSYCFEEHEVASMDEIRSVMGASQRSLDICSGPLLHVDLFRLGDREQYLFLVAHHLVIDLESWKIILKDLEDHLRSGKPCSLSPLSFQRWCNMQAAYSREHLTPERALPFDIPPVHQEYWGTASPGHTFGDSQQSGFTLDEKTTETLFGVANNAFRTQPVEIFHAALLHSFVQTFADRPPPTIFNEGHGREPWNPAIDLSRTVGWFTTLWPTHIGLGVDDSIADAVRRTKDARRQVPSNGWAYFASRYLNPAGRKAFHTRAPVEIAFNYFGLCQQFNREGAILQAPLQLDDSPSDMAGETPRFALIDVLAGVQQNCLRFDFIYSKSMDHQARIQQWLANCEQSLRMAAELLATTAATYTLCDFPLLGLTYGSLADFVEKTLSLLEIPDVEIEDAYPCSPIQQGILLSQARDPAYYRNRLLWNILPTAGSEPVDLVRLQHAWRRVVQRHAILRTVFVPSLSHNGYLDQVVLKSVSSEISVMEKSDNDQLTSLLDHQKLMSNLGQLPHRLVLRPTSGGSVHCMLEISHALIDGTSNQILQQDLQLAYVNALPNGAGPLYRKYIAYIQGLPQDSADTYWKAYLENVQPCLFPAVAPRNHVESGPRRLRSVTVDLGDNARLQTFCESRDLTMSNLLSVAWGLVLRSYTGTDHVCFGYLTSGRDMPVEGIEGIVGPFIGMLVCRLDLARETTILPVLQRQQSDYIESVQHQHYSLSHMLHLAGTSGEPLFNTAISLQKGGMGASTGPAKSSDINIKFSGGHDPSEYAIVVNVRSDKNDVHVSLTYWSTLIADTQAASVASSFSHAVNEIIDRPEVAIGQLKRVSKEDELQIAAWNKLVPERVDRCVHHLIQERCQSQPHRPAICAWDGGFSYKEVSELSTALSLYLADIGVGPEVLIPVCIEKSKWTTIAMLAIMKAGGAFVLLDASYPIQRLHAMCQQVSAPMVLTSKLHTPIARELAPKIVVIDGDEPLWYTSRTREPSYVSPDNTVYVAFTSGSTGVPKGAVIKHAGLSTGAAAFTGPYNLTSESRVLQFASYAFDLSILETLATLLVGGCICIPSENARQENLAESASKLGVTWAEFTPTVSRTLKPKDIPTLRTVVLIGERMQEVDVDLWGADVKLINAYGPTECSIISTVQPIVSKDADPSNIGFPTACLCWVVDPDDPNILMPIGAVGELLIDGPIVGDGYIGRPDITSEAFIESPSWLSHFRSDISGKLYKTGDLVQYDVDGSLRFISRKDNQVKIRGQRVELGEIEQHIQQCIERAHDVVAEIITPSWGAHTPMLVAFIWEDLDIDLAHVSEHDIFLPPSEGSRKTAQLATAQLVKRLPGYMVPAVFIPLSRLPLTKTGKKDRRKLCQKAAELAREGLAAYTHNQRAVDVKQVPSTAAEKKIQLLWAQVLNVPPDSIGLADNFFQLGGDSIAALKLMNIARGEGIILVDFFAYPILADQARALGEICPKPSPISLPAPFNLLRIKDPASFKESLLRSHQLSPDNILDALPVTGAQELAINNSHCTYFMWHIPGRIDRERLRAACASSIERHSILRAAFVPHHGRIIQVVLREATVPFVQSTTDSPDLAAFARSRCHEDSLKPVLFGVCPFRISLVSGDDSNHIMTVRMSHAQFDDSCWGGLFRDISSLYQGSELGAAPGFDLYLQHRLSQLTSKAFSFWREYLDGASMTIINHVSLGGDRRAASSSVMLSKDIPLPSLPPGVDMATIVIAAWAFVLSMLTGDEDLVFGHVVSGRNIQAPEVAQVMGPCANTVPTRVSFKHTWTVQDLLEHVQSQLDRTAEFEMSDLQDIIDRSTAWPKDTIFGSIVHHQNVDPNQVYALDGIDCKITSWEPARTPNNISISSLSQDDRLKIEVITSTQLTAASSASVILEQICNTVSALSLASSTVPIFDRNKMLNIDLRQKERYTE